MFGEDNVLVLISIPTHPFNLILGSEKHPCPTFALNPLFMTMQPLVIKISSVFVILGKIPKGDPWVNLHPCKALTLQKGRDTSWVRVWVDVWTPMGTCEVIGQLGCGNSNVIIMSRKGHAKV